MPRSTIESWSASSLISVNEEHVNVSPEEFSRDSGVIKAKSSLSLLESSDFGTSTEIICEERCEQTKKPSVV